MSARDDLLALLEEKCRAKGHEPERHVDAYRAEVLREATRKIRVARPEPLEGFRLQASYATGWNDGRNSGADLIDPDREGR